MTSELKVSDLSKVFSNVGLVSGDNVIVHSSFRSLGPVAGGPETVVQALLDVIGPDGNLMLPTFNYSHPAPTPYYDPRETPCRTGIIPEMGRKWAEAVRSLHPTHSVAVIGPDAEELTKDHLKVRTMGIGSPIDKLAKRDGKILLIGVGHTTNSTIHIGEEYAGVPKAPYQWGCPVVKICLPDGEIIEHQLDDSPSCSLAFGAVEYFLRDKGQIRDYLEGPVRPQLMRGQDVIDAVCEIFKCKPDILLCTDPACLPCVGARKNLRKQ